MNISRVATLALLLLIFPAYSDIIINSGDWHDVYLGLLYGSLKGENVHYIINLGETDLLFQSLPKNGTYTVYEKTRNPVIKDLDKFMENYGFLSVVKVEYRDYTHLQQMLLDGLDVNGFVVLDPSFGRDAIAVFPFAVLNHRWVLFYTRDNEQSVLSAISRTSKPVLFYGMFTLQPWKKIKNPSEVMCCNAWSMNTEIVRKIWQERHKWVIISDGSYIEQGFLQEGEPIITDLVPPDKLVDFLKSLNVTLVEVIGPENVNYGSRIRELSGRSIGVVAKVGRTFTGSPELTGKFYTLPHFSVPYPISELKVAGIVWFNDTAIIRIKNTGNVDEQFEVKAARFIGDDSYFLFDPLRHTIHPGETLGVPFKGNFSNLREAELLVVYGEHLEKKIRNPATKNYFFKVKLDLIPRPEKPEFVKAFYDPGLQKIWVRLKGTNRTTYARVEIHNFTLMGRSVILSSRTVELSNPDNYLGFDVYMDDSDIKSNENATLLVFYGPAPDTFTGSYSVRLGEMEKQSRYGHGKVFLAVSFVTVAAGAVAFFKLKPLGRKRKYRRRRKALL